MWKFKSAPAMNKVIALVILTCLISTNCSVPNPQRDSPKNQTPTIKQTPNKFIISAANPFAANAGREILLAGGSAIDAAIATQMVLTLVEPQSSGIGGGGFLMHFNSKTKKVESYDGRETAPQSAHPKMFLNKNETKMKFFDAAIGGLSVGVPGLLRMLEKAHSDHGKLPWARLFAPAIKLSTMGFPISKRLAKLIAADKFLHIFPNTKSYFYNVDGTPKQEGSYLKNLALARTFTEIAALGATSFYEGGNAKAITNAVNQALKNKGKMTLADLKNYTAKKRSPVCLSYRIWSICGMPPPSSGGLTTLQILGMLENFKLSELKPLSIRSIHIISEASALAFADRNIYIADPDQIPVPTSEMLDPSYLQLRAKEISIFKTKGKKFPGMPGPSLSFKFAPDNSKSGLSTSHISIIDEDGNGVSLTSSIENAFGSRLMVRGFLLNNQLTDFSFIPSKNGVPIANNVAPRKRPRSSMAPTLVFNKAGKLIMAIGSPGGSRIIGYVTKTLIATLDWKMDINQAINLPNFTHRNDSIDLEEGTKLEDLRLSLEALGHKVKIVSQTSGLQGVFVSEKGLEGGSDQRREGVSISE